MFFWRLFILTYIKKIVTTSFKIMKKLKEIKIMDDFLDHTPQAQKILD